MILRLLPSEVVDGEHFVNADLLRLISGGSSTSVGVEVEIADQRSMARSPSGPSASNSEASRSTQPAPKRGKGGSPPERLPLPSRGGKSTPRVLKVKKNRRQPDGLTHLIPK